MRKILFLDRDGTLVKEPEVDLQLDSLEKLEFIPGVFRNLYKLRKLTDYEMVVVSNQDGLGTESFPEEAFIAPHEKFLEAFRNEGVEFDAIHIDPSMPEENSPMRKPRTGMLSSYMDGSYDLENSIVVGDRMTDLELARNLGCKAILLGDEASRKQAEKAGLSECCILVSTDWDEISSKILSNRRRSVISRKTSETDILVDLSLDGSGESRVDTGLAFFDHMLDQLGKHGGFNLEIHVKGDLKVDEHHTIEDTALVLGEAFSQALGDKRGIARYSFVLPMDDALATVALDFGGRPWMEWKVEFQREMIGDMPTEMFFHFFKSFSDAAKCNLHMEATGNNEHHKIEGLFKAFAKVLAGAVKVNEDQMTLPSTKGVL